MNSQERSLHAVVEKWMGAVSAQRIRVVSFSHSRHATWRYACVEATSPSGTLALIFFRHDDGSWRVFPPERRRLTLNPAAMIS